MPAGPDTEKWNRIYRSGGHDTGGPVQRDVVREPPEPDSFDVIVVVRFLDRRLTRHIIEAIRPQGLLYYQTFIRDKVDDTGPTRPDYLLEVNELLELFNALTIRLYREEGGTGDPGRGFRNEAMLIAQRLA